MTTFATGPTTFVIDSPVRYDLPGSTWSPLNVGDLADPSELADVAHGYGTSRGDAELRELIATDTGLSREQVQATVGEIEALYLLAQATCGPGDRVLLATPRLPPSRTVPAALRTRMSVFRLSRSSPHTYSAAAPTLSTPRAERLGQAYPLTRPV